MGVDPTVSRHEIGRRCNYHKRDYTTSNIANRRLKIYPGLLDQRVGHQPQPHHGLHPPDGGAGLGLRPPAAQPPDRGGQGQEDGAHGANQDGAAGPGHQDSVDCQLLDIYKVGNII